MHECEGLIQASGVNYGLCAFPVVPCLLLRNQASREFAFVDSTHLTGI
ncbi:MAG: hypothetical protein ACI87E_004231 [Mariniblastus sp.]|jgi:hypothetical protein